MRSDRRAEGLRDGGERRRRAKLLPREAEVCLHGARGQPEVRRRGARRKARRGELEHLELPL
jgi:hypothetical protein